MSNFKGFTDSESFTQLPDSLFHHLLSQIEDAAELKVTIYFLWRVEHMDGPFRTLCETDFAPKDLGLLADEIGRGLEKAVQRGSLLKRRPERSVEGSQREADVFYFLNSPRGRAAAEAFAKGQWRETGKVLSTPPVERPNIFKLYEENIGPLTPIIADTLKEAEDLYEAEWISDAIEAAVKNNKRSWKYVEAILKRWKEEGRGKKQDRPYTEEDRRRDIKRKVDEFFKK